MSLDADIGRLYQLPLEEFTSARNALAARVKSAGDAAGAARVKALARPSVSAWAVNQLYWRIRPDFDEVVTAGDALRLAQQRALAGRKGSDVRRATVERDTAVARALKSIDGLAAKAGVDLSAQIRQRVQTTVEAIATHGSARDRRQDGRLTEDVGLPGFEALAALAAMAPPPATTSRTEGRGRGTERAASARESARRREAEVRRARAHADLAAAESHARALRGDAKRAAAEASEAATGATRAREDVDLAKRQLAHAMARATTALDALKEAKRKASQANTAATKAEAAARVAQAAVKRLEH